jgi:hypothetical protein
MTDRKVGLPAAGKAENPVFIGGFLYNAALIIQG